MRRELDRVETQTISKPLGRPSIRKGAIGWPSTVVAKWLRERIAESGNDPSVVPDEPFRFMRTDEVLRVTGFSRSGLIRKIQLGRFPKATLLRG